MSISWAGGSTRRWRRLRAAVLARDGYRCRVAVPGVCSVDAPLRGGHVHHLHGKGRCRGCRLDDPSHLVAACAPCNLHVGEPKASDPPCRPITQWT